jgi:tetratricopeptide (TPR) repeat protein
MLSVPLCIMTVAPFLWGQTYKVGSDTQTQPQQQQEEKKSNSPQKNLGWGSNIENARLARAAEEAIKNQNYTAAVEYAQRAANGAPGDPRLWFLLGYSARLAKKFQLSIEAYNHGLRLDPSSLDGLSGLAQTDEIIGKTEDATKLLNQVLAADPRRASDAELLGEIYLRGGDYDQAISTLTKVENTKPSARAEVLMALSYERVNKMDQARHYLDLAKHRAPNNPEVERSLAGFYRDTGNYPAAISELKNIKNPAPDVKAELAFTYQLDGKPEDAARVYDQAANSAPGDVNLQLSAAQAEVAIGGIDRAEPFLKRATALDAGHYRLHAILGQIDRLEEQNDDAVREYVAALAALPQTPPEGPLYGIQLHMNLVELYKGLDNEADSHHQLEIAQSEIATVDGTGPHRSDFLRLRAMIEMNAGDLNAADKDLQEALSLNAKDANSLQLDGDLLVKMGRPDDAIAVYKQILAMNPINKDALVSLGFVSRENGHDQEAEKYFHRLAAAYPKLYIPYLALGDMYASRKDYSKAQESYHKAHQLAPRNALAVAGGMNAAIEAKNYPLAADWLKDASPEVQRHPLVMREAERYYSWTKDYKQSAAIGEEVIQKLPKDRDVVVYLGYDLLALERYDDLLALTTKYESLLPKEADIPLLAGYVHKHFDQREAAEADFTHAIERDPNMVTGYVNRGYVLHDLRQPKGAVSDFETALRLEPNNAEAHLGLAYASLDMHRPKVALRQLQLAVASMGDSEAVHLIKATAYGQEGLLVKSSNEYREALKYAPEDGNLHMALADTLYTLNRFRETLDELHVAEKLSSNNSVIYAKLARTYGKMHDRDNTMQNVQLAESYAQTSGEDQSEVFVATGEALSLLGDRKAAMDRFARALSVPNSDRILVRLAIAKQMVADGEADDARRQVALGLMEARAGDTQPPTSEEWVEAADVFLALHDYQLAQDYFQRALAAGAPEMTVRVGLANSYLATGDTPRAEDQISSIGTSGDTEPSYQYLLAKANVLRQQRQNVQALTAFAQAADAAGEDPTANQALLEAAGDEGYRLNDRVSVLSDFSVEPIFEDTTVYPLDAKLDVTNPVPGRQGLLPLPRSSIQTQWTGAFHLHFADLPGAAGFFQIRNARGEISLPSANTIINRDTTDYTFNFSIAPSVHLGTDVITFNTGLQETIRRDSLDPVDMNQNLFRQFVYMSTSSFFDVIALDGYAIREAGPFTLRNESGRDLAGALEFRVGHPWGNTALVTGWGARDEQFNPVIREFYYTSAYIGIDRKVSEKLRFRAVAEDLRAWRIEINRYAISQALRPAGTVQYFPTRNWSIEGSAAYSRNQGFHAYDAVQSGFAVSYAMPIHRTFKEDGNDVELVYPIRFSAGMQQEDFFEFTGGHNEMFRPYVRITVF